MKFAISTAKKRVGELKKKLAEAKTIKERERLIELIRRRTPWLHRLKNRKVA